jgi:DnaB-like helicase C terminal domain/Bifunctional DNA primase/polymerase, N-terminal/Primase C terminal 1 (PriCT-1)
LDQAGGAVMGKQLLESALRYAALGWPVFPLSPRSKIPYPGSEGFKEATTDKVTITSWWSRQPESNIGIPTAKHRWVLDVDKRSGGFETLEELEAKYNKLPNTIRQVTGSGGRQYFFCNSPIDIRNSAGKLGPGLDVRGIGGYVVVPPSIHPSGNPYDWDGMDEIEDQKMLPAPQWLIKLLHQTEKHKPADDGLAPIPEGQRESYLVGQAGRLRNASLSEVQILNVLKETNLQRCVPPLPEKDIRRIAGSAGQWEPGTITTQEPPPEVAAKHTAKQAAKAKQEEVILPRQATAIISEQGGLEGYISAKEETGVLSPWPILNQATGGLRAGELIIVAGSTARGKTAFALNYAKQAAKNKVGVALFELEMSESELVDRLLCLCGDIELQQVKNGRVSDYTDLERAADILHELPIYIFDCPGLTLALMANSLKRLREQEDIGLVICDNLQLMSGSRRYDNRVQEVSLLSRGLKLMAKEANLPFLVISHLSRSSGREKRKPELFDLRDSGTIEQDANSVFFLHGKDEYGEYPPNIVDIELVIGKQRSGPRGKVIPLRFHRHIGKFEEKDRP